MLRDKVSGPADKTSVFLDIASVLPIRFPAFGDNVSLPLGRWAVLGALEPLPGAWALALGARAPTARLKRRRSDAGDCGNEDMRLAPGFGTVALCHLGREFAKEE